MVNLDEVLWSICYIYLKIIICLLVDRWIKLKFLEIGFFLYSVLKVIWCWLVILLFISIVRLVFWREYSCKYILGILGDVGKVWLCRFKVKGMVGIRFFYILLLWICSKVCVVIMLVGFECWYSVVWLVKVVNIYINFRGIWNVIR